MIKIILEQFPIFYMPQQLLRANFPATFTRKQKNYRNNYKSKLKAGFACAVNFNSCGVISNSKIKNNGKNYQLQKKSSREQGILCT